MTTSTVTRTRGDDWEIQGPIEFAGAPVDLTDATLASKLRETSESTTATATFTAAVVGDPTEGIVKLSLARATTANINPRDAYVYDIEVTKGGKKTTYGVGSKLVVKGDATK